ncbi:hypothetical protein AAHF58_000195 [Escherichia coli]
MKELELKYYARSNKGLKSIFDACSKLYDCYSIVDRKIYNKLESYYDDEEYILHKQGVYARLDKKTNKFLIKHGSHESGLFNREEIVLCNYQDFSEFVDCLGVNLTQLRPQFYVMTARVARTIDTGVGLVEICTDAFNYAGIGRYTINTSANYELEFELKSGDEKALDIIREMMLEYVGDDLSPSEISKAERGFQLMTKEG